MSLIDDPIIWRVNELFRTDAVVTSDGWDQEPAGESPELLAARAVELWRLSQPEDPEIDLRWRAQARGDR
jgi:hypothetical protein